MSEPVECPSAETTRQLWENSWKAAPGSFDERTNFWVNTDRVKYKFVRTLIDCVDSQGPALEVGCGTATISSWLHKDTLMSIYILDLSREALGLAVPRFHASQGSKHFLAIQGDAFHLPFQDDSFSFVHSYGLLEHFGDLTPVVREMVRVLGPGGVFFADIAPRKFSLDLLFDLFLLPPYIAMMGIRYCLCRESSFRSELLRRVGEWRYLFSFFFEDRSRPNKFATGGFESRLDCHRLEEFLTDGCGLTSIRMTGSMLLPSNVYRVLWRMSPGIHRWIQGITENKRWTIPCASGIWVSGRKL